MPLASTQDRIHDRPRAVLISLSATFLCYNDEGKNFSRHREPRVKKSSPQNLDMSPSLRDRRRVLLLGSLFLLLLALTVSVIRHPSFLVWFGLSSSAPATMPETDDTDNADVDLITVAALASEETTSGKFRSGGLGLSRTAWEVLHGTPETISPDTLVYQDNTYKVTYQQDLVWQIEKSWGTTSPVPQQVRARIRRYLPLDSHLAETMTKSDDTIVDVYRSHMLAQLLSPQPPEPPAKKSKRQPKDLPTESCVVVHRLNNQKVISSLLYIGAPKPEGYFPPQSQTAPATTTATAGKNPVRNEARKEPVPKGKGKSQGQS